MRWLILIALVIVGLHECVASHFRGALVSWKPTGNPNQIEIKYRQSWRRSSNGHYCDQDTIGNNTLIGGGGSLTCPTCPSSIICGFSYYCTDFSVNEDWTTGEGSCIYDIELTSFQIKYTGSAWITLNNNGGSWSIEAWVNFAARPDNGAINSSPITNMQPIMRTRYGCPYTIKIPTSDPDGDDVRCRWPTTASESGVLTFPPMDMTLNEHDCTLTFTAHTLGWWGLPVIIEDFISPSSNTTLSKTPLQFLVEVSPNSDPCETAYEPVLVNPSPQNGQCVGIMSGDTYHAEIRAKNNAPGQSIAEIDTVSPHGMIKSPVHPVPGFDDEYFVTVQWTPTALQQGPNIFCFAASDGLGQTSEQRCITILAGTSGPVIDMNNVIPAHGSEVPENQESWRLAFSEEFIVSNDTAYIRFYDHHNYPVFFLDVSASQFLYPSGKNLTFSTNGLNLIPGRDYYILVDEGLVSGTSNCNPDSPGIHVPWEWRFSVEEPERVTWFNTTIIDDGPVITTKAPAIPVRLIGGEHDNEGRVEVYVAGEWGTVCDDGFAQEEANVVCRQLGYMHGNRTAHCCSHFGKGSGLIWMDDLACDGSESDLGKCVHRGWGVHNCDHSEDASVTCAGGVAGPSADVDCSDRMLTVYIPRTVIGENEAEHTHFIDDSCVGSHHNDSHVRISTPFNRCGTVMKVRGNYVVFSNIVIDEPLLVTTGDVITRNRHIEIPVECNIERDGLSSLFSFNPDTSKIVFREDGYGVFSFNLSLYQDQSFSTPYPRDDYPIDVKLRDMLYFEALASAEPGLEIFLETCMATTTTDVNSSPQYAFIEDGCYKNSTLVQYSSGNPLIQRFGLEAFAFVGFNTPVYAHCYLKLCNISDHTSRCSQGCISGANNIRHGRAVAASGSKSYVMTQGPLNVNKEDAVGSETPDDDNQSNLFYKLGLFICAVGFATLCLTNTFKVILKSRRKMAVHQPVSANDDE